MILVNSNTASASEIVAGAMQDHDRALIVGQTSFGKGLVQGIFQMEYGTGLTLTTAQYYTLGRRLARLLNAASTITTARRTIALDKKMSRPSCRPESRPTRDAPRWWRGMQPYETIKTTHDNEPQDVCVSDRRIHARLVNGSHQWF